MTITPEMRRLAEEIIGGFNYDTCIKLAREVLIVPEAKAQDAVGDDEVYYAVLGILGDEYSRLTGSVQGAALKVAVDAIRPYLRTPHPIQQPVAVAGDEGLVNTTQTDTLNNILIAWVNYKQDMKPETRNMFLRKFNAAYPSIAALAQPPTPADDSVAEYYSDWAGRGEELASAAKGSKP